MGPGYEAVVTLAISAARREPRPVARLVVCRGKIFHSTNTLNCKGQQEKISMVNGQAAEKSSSIL